MKSIIRLSFLAVVVSVVAAGSASADDQRLQDRQARSDAQPSRTTTVAVYANNRGTGRHEVRAHQQTEDRFELRSTAHGQVYGAYATGR
jgi:hypothetical protein